MGSQEIAVIVIFLLAVLYLGRMVYRGVTAKKECASGCGKCAADLSKIKIPETK